MDRHMAEQEQHLIHLVTQINGSVNEIRKTLDQHIADEASQLSQYVAELIAEAFPEGDLSAHKRIHEAAIAKAQAQAAFWQDMARSVSRYGLVGFIGWLIYAAWAAFLRGPQ